MMSSIRAIACLSVVVSLGLSSTVRGETVPTIRDYGTPYTDVSNFPWSGTVHFAHPTSGLAGDIDWIVYGPGQFPYGDSGYEPQSGYYTYAYQIANTGSVAISSFTFDLDEPIDQVDFFISSGRVEGAEATGTDWKSGPGGFVDWAFDGINGSELSAGLVFTSPKAPTVTTTGVVWDGGSTAEGIELPIPGPNYIPEPSSMALLLAGLAFVVARRSWRR